MLGARKNPASVAFMDRIQPMLKSLVDYPIWLWLPCLLLVAAASLWLFIKLCQWTIRVLLFACLVGLAAGLVYLVFHLFFRP